jgi:hypothetical protein
MLTLEQTREVRNNVLIGLHHLPECFRTETLIDLIANGDLPPLHPDEWKELSGRAQLPAWDGSVPPQSSVWWFYCSEDIGSGRLSVRDIDCTIRHVGPEALAPPSSEWLRWSAECERRYAEASE